METYCGLGQVQDLVLFVNFALYATQDLFSVGIFAKETIALFGVFVSSKPIQLTGLYK